MPRRNRIVSRSLALAVSASLITACGSAASPADAADSAHPIVVELYQSQGCSSCPPAIANLNALAEHPGILALDFAVTYWDQLGWKDTFAKREFTARQWDYAKAGGRDSVGTPQMVVNGRGVLTGGQPHNVKVALRRYDRGDGGPAIAAAKGRVTIGKAAAKKPAIVWLVRYDPRTLRVKIGRGENGGKTLPHKNIVRSLQQLGDWSGDAVRFDLPDASNSIWKSAILVQQGKGGAIVAARKL